MADQYDGEVRINTELDTSGFVGGSDDLIKALGRIEQSINRLGTTAGAIFQQLSKTRIGAPQVPTEDEMKVPPPEMDTRDLDRQTRRVQDDMNSVRSSLRQQNASPDSPHVDTTQLDDDARRVSDDMRTVHDAMRSRPDDEQLEPRVKTDRLNEDVGRVQSAMQYIRSALRRQPDKPEEPRIDTEALDESTQRVQDDMGRARAALDTELPTPTVENVPESAQFEKEADRIQTSLNRITNEIGRMINTSAQGFRSTSAVLAFSDRLDVAAERIADAQKALDDFAKTEIPTDQYRETTAAIERAERALLKLYDRRDTAEDMGVSEDSAQWQRLELQIRNAEEEVERYEMAADRMRETGQAFVDPQTTTRYQQMVDQLQQMEQAYQTNVGLIQQEQIEQERVNVLSAQEAVANAASTDQRQSALQELMNAQNQLAAVAQQSVTPAPDPEAMTSWQMFGARLKEVGAQAVEVAKKLGEGAWKGIRIAINGVKKAVTGLLSGLKSITSVAKKTTSSILGLFTSAHKSGNAVEGLLKKLTGLKRMLVSRLKRTFISYLFQQITESIKALARFDQRFDKSISNLRNRAKELSANTVAAFGGLLRQIEPYITRLLEAFTQGVVRISAVLAALRGETTMPVAIRQTESYAASLDSAAASADSAREAQERLNRALTSYDEIHKLGEDDKDVVDVAPAGENAPLYQNVPVQAVFTGIDSAVRDAIDRLIQSIRSGDWYGAGAAVAEGLNLVVYRIDDAILRIRQKAVDGAHAIAEALNGLVDNFDAYALGATVADALNTAVDVAYEFLTTFNFERFGERIGEAITGFLANFDADRLGRTIATILNDAVNFAFGLISGTNFGLLGRRLGEAINGLLDEFNPERLGETIAAAINAAFQFAYSLLTTINFRQLGENLAASLNSFTDNFDAAQVGRTIVAAINGVIDFAYEAVTNYDWSRLGERLGQLFNQLFGGGYEISERATRQVGGAARDQYEEAMARTVRGIDWGEIARLLSAGIIGVFNTFATFIETTDWEAVGEAIVEFLSNVDWAGIARAMIHLLGEALGGLAGLVRGALGFDTELTEDDFQIVMGGVNVSDGGTDGQSLISTHVFDGLAQQMTDQYRGEFEDAGEDIGEGIMAGFTSVFRRAEQRVKTAIFDPLVAGLKRAFDIASPSKKMKPYGEYIADGLLEGIASRFEAGAINAWVEANIRDNFTRAITQAFSITGGIARGMLTCGNAIAEGIRTGIINGWQAVGLYLSDRVAAIQDFFRSGNFVQAGLNVITGLGRGIADAATWETSVGRWLGERARQIRDAFGDFVSRGRQIIEELGRGIGDEGSWASNVTSRASALADRIRGAFTGFVERGRQIVSDISSGLNSNQNSIDQPSTSLADRIRNAFSGFAERGRQIVRDLGSGLSNNQTEVDTPSTSLADRIRNAFSGFVDRGRQIITDLGSGLTDQGNWDRNVGGPATERAGWIRGAFTGFIERGREIISQLGGGITDQGNWDRNIGGPVTERSRWIAGGFQNGGDFWQAGANIVAGLNQGIVDNFSTSRQIAENLGGVVQDAFNHAMGIYSPSRVMAEAGGYVVAGLVEGIDGESNRAYATMRNLATGIISEADNMEIEPELSVTTRGLDAVADKLSAIAEVFENIRQTLREFPTLRVPSVAAGEIAPANTRVAVSGNGGDLQELKAMLATFIDRVTALEEEATGRPIRVESTVVLDRHTIGSAVAEYNRSNNTINNGKGGAW